MAIVQWFRDEWKMQWPLVRFEIYRWGLAAVIAAIPATLVYTLSKMAKQVPPWAAPASVFVILIFLFFFLRSRMPSAESPIVRSPRKKKSSNKFDLRAEPLDICFHHKRLPISNDVFVLLRVSVVNHGQEELAITHWGLEAWVGDGSAAFELVDTPEHWRVRRHEIGKAITEEHIPPNPMNPLRKGIPNIYWLNFKMHTLGHSLPPNNAMYVMTITDGLGGVHDAGSWGPGFFEEDAVLLTDYAAS
jgi:hypothetical protein